jgi:hypothetical protein
MSEIWLKYSQLGQIRVRVDFNSANLSNATSQEYIIYNESKKDDVLHVLHFFQLETTC